LLPDTDAPPSKDQPLIVYAGEITVFRGIYEMILAMDLLPQQLGASLILAGRFSPPELEDEVKKKPGWEKVKYHGWKSRDILMPLIAKSQVGLVLFHPLPNHIEAQPNKLFEYMSMKIPLVASDFPLWRKIIGEINCGFLVDPLDPKAIAEAMQWLIEHPDEARAMGERGQKAVLNQYNWKHESQKLLKVYKEITG
jgi:glycosyltransferase involved in cell wall biosynthesis